MTPTDPRHGTERQTLRTTVAGCMCEYCERNRTHRRRRTKLKKMGRGSRLDPTPILAHIDRLLANGWNQQNIAKAAGIGVATLCDLRTGRSQAVTPRVAAALLALKGRPEGPWIPATGTLRRLEALQAMGWPMREVCKRAGLTPRYGNQLRYTGQAHVSADAAARIEKVYNELSMTALPSDPKANHARAVARRNGGVVPLAWDDSTIDDPAAKPQGAVRRKKPVPRKHTDLDPALVDRILAGDYKLKATPVERVEVYRRWTAVGRTLAELERLTGWNSARDLKRNAA